jgi:putative ABC transport system permease protein
VTRWLHTTFQPFRALGAFSVLWLVSLAIGIAIATVSFTHVARNVLDRLALPKANQIYVITRESPSLNRQGLSKGLIQEIREVQHIDAAGAISTQQRLSAQGVPTIQVRQLNVMPHYFRLLSVKPLLGERLDASDADSEQVMISHALWQGSFKSDPAILSRIIEIGGEPKRIKGVLPAVMRRVADEDIFAVSLFDNMQLDGEFSFRVIARRYKNLSESAFQKTLDQALASRRARTDKVYSANTTLRAETLKTARTLEVRDSLAPILSLVALLLLLMACNAASLFAVSVLERIHGLAIESALGATLMRLLRQILWQSFVFTLVAAVIAAPLCPLLFAAARTYFLEGVALQVPVEFDWRIWVGVTLIFAALNALAAFLPSAVILSKSSLNRTDRTLVTTQGARFARMALAFQLIGASAVILLAMLLLRSLSTLNAIHPGFELPRLLTASLVLPNRSDTGKYEKDAAAHVANLEFLDGLRKSLGKIEGVHAISFASEAPLLPGRSLSFELRLEGIALEEKAEPIVNLHAIDEQYAQALKLELALGRLPRFQAETAEQEAAVNEAYVRRYGAQQNVIGRRIEGRNVRIVGVLKDFKQVSLAREAQPAMYVPMALDFLNEVKVLVRVDDGFALNSATSLALGQTISERVHDLEPNVPVSEFKSGELLRSESLRDRIGLSRVLWLFSVLSILTATLGLFSLGAYSVTKRRREFGLRAAFGATPYLLMRQVMTENLRFCGYCVAAGLVIGSFLSNLMSAKLYRITWTDGVSLLVTLSIMIAVCLLAALWPAWRASRVTPTKNLRVS